ncbi:hypothetical protein HDV04_003750 [Boothiomyces sp. JEL0838]|nr:hypothetical protein HDV04_003750 [Boothiomyces sp. JEL0838]
MEGTLDPIKTNALSNGVTFNSEDTINDEPLTDQLPPLSPNSKIPSFKIPHAHRMSIVSAISEQPSFISSASSDAIFEVSPVEAVKSGQPKRRRIMNEILDTEIRYVSDLQFLKTQYYEPLLALVGTPEEIIPKKAIMDIFGHHESILAVNRELSNQLQKRIELWNRGNDLIGDIFVSLSKAAHPDSHGLVLQAFLVLPVQRIPRYKLLLEDLFKHTPEDHPDHENIKKAIESVSQESEAEKTQWIESIRKAITEWHVENEAIHDRLPSNSPIAEFDAPIWMPDESAQSCLVCFNKFTFFNRKHHCRSCGILVCGACSQNSFYIPSRNGEKKARVCDTCLPSLIQERKFSINAPRSLTPENQHDVDGASIYSTSPVNISERRSSMLPSGSSIVSSLLISKPKRIAKSLTAESLYSSIIGSPKSHIDCCTLCKEKFTFFHKEIRCKSCDRIVCAGCASKDSSKQVCDPCVLGVSPIQIFVNPKGGNLKGVELNKKRFEFKQRFRERIEEEIQNQLKTMIEKQLFDRDEL